MIGFGLWVESTLWNDNGRAAPPLVLSMATIRKGRCSSTMDTELWLSPLFVVEEEVRRGPCFTRKTGVHWFRVSWIMESMVV
jgi:hypothetical protein